MQTALTTSVPQAITTTSELYVRQQHEMGELFGIETRNKYAISDGNRTEVAFAAEQQKGILGMIMRQFMGHWRSYDIAFFNTERKPMFRAHHPFRFIFQRLELIDQSGAKIGALQQRFAIMGRHFDVEGPHGNVLLEMRAGFFSIWKFPFFKGGEEVAVVEKKWSGALSEMLTDKDNFRVAFKSSQLTAPERILILAAAVFVDLQYFETKAR